MPTGNALNGFGLKSTVQQDELIETPRPLFEAGFNAGGARAYLDVLLPLRKKGQKVWRLVEVKSSSKVTDTHKDDVAIQAYIARASGVKLDSVALAHIDSQWVYPGGGDYQGLLKEVDLTEDAFEREEEVQGWIAAAQLIARKRKEPDISAGRHCSEPYACGFLDYCQSDEVEDDYPVSLLPGNKNNKLRILIEVDGVSDLRHVPDELLNPKQLRVKTHTLAGSVYFNADGAATALAQHKLPALFLDFETINLAVPIWKGTRPTHRTNCALRWPSNAPCSKSRPPSRGHRRTCAGWGTPCWPSTSASLICCRSPATITTTPINRASGASRTCCRPLPPTCGMTIWRVFRMVGWR